MNRIELYNKTTTTLLNAYKNGTLFHGDCSACAVGNICGGNPSWRYVIGSTSYHNGKKYEEIPNFVVRGQSPWYMSESFPVIKSTG